MRRLGTFILRGPMQAIALTSLLTMLSLLLPFLAYVLSGVSPSLVTLRQGPIAGLQVIIGSLVVITVFTLLININPQITTAFLVGIWVPLWLCANILRNSESQGRMILAAGICGLVYIMVMYLVIGDVPKWWTDWLNSWITQTLPTEQGEQYLEILTSAAPLMNAMMAAGLVISLILTILIARWWQALLYHPGGFRKEFHALNLPRGLLLAVLAGLVLMVMGKSNPGSPVLDILVLLVFLYLFQGIAMIHRMIAARGMSKAWLVVMYALLFVVPQAILFLACLGMVDSWIMKTAVASRNDNSL
ncbi:MAG: DUF2232 domain-containing protein [Gammaproteobacteria bacterium]|nr:DUF2232 domain-containing protein [Gammaproteobacteria bacterium]